MTHRPGVALIGAGFMGEVHARAARAAGLTVVGIAASTPVRSTAAAARLGIDTAYPDAAAALADDRVSIVHVLTPNASHHELASAALAAGKHVVCEKPLATNVADAADLVQRADASGLVAAVPFVYRFHPMAREMRARVASGATGTIASVQGAYLQDWLLGSDDDNWRVDPAAGGASRAFGDIGSHLCDLLEFTTGDRIARLQAITRTVIGERPTSGAVTTEDLVGVLAQLEGGAVASLLVSQVAPGRKNGLVLELHGSAESLRFEQENPELLWIGRREGSVLQPRDPAALSPDAARLSVLPAGHPLGYQDAFTAFVCDVAAAVNGDTPDGLPLFADGERAARITDAVLASAGSGEWVGV
ncbi:Gfo/Idh/MocA family protein [Homoserinibacter sp. GY 40078]|uniref:Gfo/Idh/MocA family protein n=1 Tax=Homoserinibacter sp. GY 40078 TaxID=2603275 RepID=UPI0011CCA51C|nr:Gfo/Idh/MocA family oxidoreductase [Homoserinibacter sp. GY 40078]TXK18748.1 Gfo/Idh/MocA family oxidoreductase [Homoserinibacter sp. GY 40078]